MGGASAAVRFVAFHPVHLAKVIDGPVGQGGSEGQCRVDAGPVRRWALRAPRVRQTCG